MESSLPQSLLSRMRVWLTRLLLPVVFLLSLGAGLLIHLDLPASRRAAASILESILNDTLEGTLRIGSLSRLAGGGLGVEDLEVFDPDGRKTLVIEQLTADLDLLDLLDRTLGDYDKLSIQVPRVRASGCEIYFLPTTEVGEDGQVLTHVSLKDAFTPRKRSDSSPGKSAGRPVRVWFPDIRLKDVFARGSVAGSPVVEARAYETQATVLASDLGAAVDVSRFQLEASGLGGVDIDTAGEVHVRAPGAVWGLVRGNFGQLPVVQKFRYENGEFDLQTLATVAPEAARPLWVEWPLDREIIVKNALKGTAEQFAFRTEIHPAALQSGVASQGGPIILKGKVFLDGTEHATAEVSTAHVDLNSFHSSFPVSDLSSVSQLRVDWPGGTPFINLETRVEEGRINGLPTPAAEGMASWKGDQWVVDATLSEVGLKAYAHAEQTKAGPYLFDIRLPKTPLRASTRLKEYLPQLDGTAEGNISGRLVGTQLTVDLDLDLAGLQGGGISVARSNLSGRIEGDVGHPEELQGNTQLNMAQAVYPPVQLTQVKVLQSGPVLRPHLELSATTAAGLALTAAADVDLVDSHVRGFEAKIEGRGKPLEASIDHIGFSGDTLVIDEFLLKSIGQISGSASLGPGKSKIQAQARELNMSRIGEALGLSQTEIAGELEADVDLELSAAPQGRIDIGVRDGALRGISGISLAATAEVDGKEVTGEFSTGIEGLGDVEADWEARLAGPPLHASSYAGATGHWNAKIKGLDLNTLSLLFGSQLPVSRMQGALDLDLTVKQRESSGFPAISLAANTQGLSVVWTSGDDVHTVDSLDAELVTNIPSGGHHAETALRVRDRHGMLASLSGEVTLPLREWLENPPESDQLLGELGNGAIDFVALLPRRRVDTWPDALPRPVKSGAVSARIAIAGTLSSPDLGIVLTGNGLQGGESPMNEAVDVSVKARYRAGTGSLRGSLSVERKERRLGESQFDLTVPWLHLQRDVAPDVPFWTGTAQLQLDSTPLELVSAIDALKLKGFAQGTIQVARSGLMPELSSRLQFRRLMAGDNALGDAEFEANTHGQDLVVRAEFTDDYGSLDASGELSLIPDSLLAHADPQKSIFLNLRSQKYDAAVLQPFLSGVFDEFSGTLEGTLNAELSPPPEISEGWKTRLTGRLDMKDGVLLPSALGLRLTDVQMNLSAEEEGGYNLVRLSNIAAQARGTQNSLQGQAEIYFKNLQFQGGNFDIRAKDLPLMTDGATLATLTGTAGGKLALNDEALKMSLKMDDFTITLPEISETDLIDLSDNPTIEIVQRAKPEVEEAPPADTLPLLIQFELANNVRVKNKVLDLRLRGSPILNVDDGATVSGKIDLVRGGRITVLGRSFVIERGSVAFDTGDATNPHLQVLASWTAPNGVIVKVEVGGTAKEATLRWSSDPALPGGEADIMALVLGSGTGSSEQVGITSLAIAANEAIGASGVSWMEVYATQELGSGDGRIASLTDSSWNSYTAAFRINDELWFEGSVQTSSGAGMQAEQDPGVSGTLDWRFHPQWSLRTEFGQLGGGLDLLWQYRY